MSVMQRRISGVQHIRSNPTSYPRGPLPFELLTVADGPVNGYGPEFDLFGTNPLGIAFIVGAPRSGNVTAFGLRRQQQPVFRGHPVNTICDMYRTERGLLMATQTTVKANRAAATVTGMEICKFCTYQAYEICISERWASNLPEKGDEVSPWQCRECCHFGKFHFGMSRRNLCQSASGEEGTKMK
jgi:hypothetical protein